VKTALCESKCDVQSEAAAILASRDISGKKRVSKFRKRQIFGLKLDIRNRAAGLKTESKLQSIGKIKARASNCQCHPGSESTETSTPC
jgi:hypothetical protein